MGNVDNREQSQLTSSENRKEEDAAHKGEAKKKPKYAQTAVKETILQKSFEGSAKR